MSLAFQGRDEYFLHDVVDIRSITLRPTATQGADAPAGDARREFGDELVKRRRLAGREAMRQRLLPILSRGDIDHRQALLRRVLLAIRLSRRAAQPYSGRGREMVPDRFHLRWPDCRRKIGGNHTIFVLTNRATRPSHQYEQRGVQMGAGGDRAAFDRLIVEAIPAMLRFATRLCGNTTDAEDIMQDALLRAARNWRSFRGDAKISTWLFRIVINVFRDRHRALEPTEQEIAVADAIHLGTSEADEFGAIGCTTCFEVFHRDSARCWC